MGGYAAYVWSAFGFALAALLALLVQSWYAARSREAELDQLRSVVRAGRSRPRHARRPAHAAPPPENA
jgi:heme exporter protein D